MAATLTARGSELHHVIGRANRFGIVLHDDDRIASVAKPMQQSEQAIGVAWVQADGGFVEHVQGVDQL